MSRDLRRELDAASDDPRVTTTWQPQVGDTLVGVVRAVTKVASKFSETPQTCVTLDDDETGAPVNVYCRHAVLEREITDKQPAIGDRLAIKRLMDDPAKGYRRYKVIVERAEVDDVSFVFGPDTDRRA